MGLEKLADQGPAWALLVISIGVIAYLFRQLTKEREQCTADWRNHVAGTELVIKEWTVANEYRTQALEASVKALALIPPAVGGLTEETKQTRVALIEEMRQLRSLAAEAMQSHREMREALLKRGVDL